jgi:hypothetical protein
MSDAKQAMQNVIQNKAYVSRPLAVAGMNYPNLSEDGKKIVMQQVPIYVPTTLSHARMMGRALREMVVPSMLPTFIQAIHQRSPDVSRKVQMIMGGPGIGKSYMPYMISRMRTEEPPLVFDASRKSLGDAIVEITLDPASNNALSTRFGALAQAYKEGRELIIDEYPNAKEGTEKMLDSVWQVMIGEVQSFIAPGSAGLSVPFNRDELKQGFYATVTGNFSDDGAATHELAASTYSRLDPQFLPPATVMDWQHRFCQMLSGVPVTTLYAMNESYWSKSPKQFGQVLKQIRELGLTENEKQRIPSWQYSFLANWENLIIAAQQAPEAYCDWYEILHAKQKKVAGTGIQVTPAVLGELNESYVRRVIVDMRRMGADIQKALDLLPPCIDASTEKRFAQVPDFCGEPPAGLVFQEPVEKNFGTRFAAIFLRGQRQTTQPFGKDNLQAALFANAQAKGFAPVASSNGGNASKKTIAELLNCETVGGVVIDKELVALQDKLCGYLRSRFPGLPLENDLVLPANRVGQALAVVDEELGKARAGYQNIAVFDPQAVVGGDVRALPLQTGTFADLYWLNALPEGEQKEALDQLQQGQPLGTEELLLSFAIPTYGQRNIDAMWRYSIAEVTNQSGNAAIQMADAQSSTNLAITLLTCRDETKDAQQDVAYTPNNMVVVSNRHTAKTAFFGTQHIKDETRLFLREAGLYYVNTAQGEVDIDRTLDEIIGTKDRAALKQQLAAALTCRSERSSTEGQTLTQLIMRPEPSQPIYALKNIL